MKNNPNIHPLQVEIHRAQLLSKTLWQFLTKLTLMLPHDLEIPLIFIGEKLPAHPSFRGAYTEFFFHTLLSTSTQYSYCLIKGFGSDVNIHSI
jgi:hypothetical protein